MDAYDFLEAKNCEKVMKHGPRQDIKLVFYCLLELVLNAEKVKRENSGSIEMNFKMQRNHSRVCADTAAIYP